MSEKMSEKWIDLSGKVAIVTGGAMGIGEAIVKDLKGCGAKVAIFDMAEPKDYQEDEDTLFIKLNICDRAAVEEAVDQVEKKFGHVDALINNAGVTRPRILVDYYKECPQYELSDADFDFMVGVNEKGTYIMTQTVARKLFEQKSGVIINMSSCAGLMGSRGHSCYSATKAAIHGFTISWAKELGPFGIRVVGVHLTFWIVHQQIMMKSIELRLMEEVGQWIRSRRNSLKITRVRFHWEDRVISQKQQI